MKQEILRFENVTCKKDGAVYLDNFSFYMTAGEIVGMLSVNDRGIQELIELTAKNHPIDAGRVYMGGKLVNSYLNQEETSNRIYQIDQKSSLINDLSITDNLFVMRPGFKKQVINEWVLREQADRVLKQLSMDLDLNKRVERLTTMERIMVEIAKAYLMGSKLLVVLYPEKLIGQADFPQFHQLLRKMQSMGISTLYFCYHHWIMFKICDRIALFSRGRIKKLFEPEEFREEAIAPYIYYFKENTVFKPKVDRGYMLELKNITDGDIHNLSLGIKPGECITLLDSGDQIMDRLTGILAGEYVDYEGDIFCSYKKMEKKVKSSLDRGMIVLDDNPAQSFLFSEMSYLENLTFLLDRKLKKSILKQSYINSVRSEYYGEAGDVIDTKYIDSLSLKEKYGLIYNKISLFHPKILVVKKPFAYGDMHCRTYILKRMQELKAAGVSILLLTGYLTDCVYISDHIGIVKDGSFSVLLEPQEYGITSRLF